VPAPAIEPLSAHELRQSLRRPDLLAANVLGATDRLSRNLSQGQGLWWLVAVLLTASVLAAIPYGAICPTSENAGAVAQRLPGFYRIAVLFTGSLLICFPCLYMFLQLLGFRISLARNLALSLVVTGTAGLFTLGFFPIVWFIDATMNTTTGGASVTAADISRLLLSVSLLLGIVQMIRCLLSRGWSSGESSALFVLMGMWIPLLVFITYRMACLLGLTA
jgi:hypothetical protein